MRYLFTFCCLVVLNIFNGNVKGQDSISIPHVMNKIRSQQTQADPQFLKGIFPSYISNSPKFDTGIKDNNIFFNGLIHYTLLPFKKEMNPELVAITDSILAESSAALIYFKNNQGRNTYNFWRTDTVFNFPYTRWIGKVRGNITLPDDMDDTVLGLMLAEAPDSIAAQVHLLMQQYINKGETNVKTAYKSYRQFSAYSTWFGKKFPVVFDVSVLCNVLSFVQQYDLQWTMADSASLDLIIYCIQQNDHINHPAFISPYYGKTSLILYHIARLMQVKKLKALENIKPTLIQQAILTLKSSDNILEKIILESALMKWGYYANTMQLESIDLLRDIEESNFCFFIGNIPSYFSQPFKEILIDKGILLFYHYCPAYNYALLLEYLLLKNTFDICR